jgi:hypothetical protein
VNNEKRKLIQTYLEKYLVLKNPELNIIKNKMFECPFKHEHNTTDNHVTCKIYPTYGYKLKCLHPSHANNNGFVGDIFDVCRKYEPEMAMLDDVDIGEYLIQMLDIQTDDEALNTLAVYANSGFNLIPLQNGHIDTKDSPKNADKNKTPIGGVSWKTTMSGSLPQWQEWKNANLNFGLVLGKVSNVVAIDIDDANTLEKVKDLLGDTSVQTTSRGFHYLYEYEDIYDNVNHVNLRSKGYEMELRANNAYIVVSPSSVRGEKRIWNGKKIQKMSKELKDFLFSLIEVKSKIEQTPEEAIKEAIEKDSFSVKNGLTGLDGECNDAFIKYGGVLRKKMSPEQVEWALTYFNKMLKNPIDYTSLKRMTYQISKYYKYDKQEMAELLYERLKKLEACTARDLSHSLKIEVKDVEDVLLHLVDEGKAKKFGKLYRCINKVDWDTDFMSVGKPLSYKIPFFDDYARFDEGALVIIGGSSGTGKTHLSCNFIKGFVDQGITPNLICTEAGSKFGIVSASLGLKLGDFKFKVVSDATNVELEDDAVTIIDWLKPKDSDYAKTDSLYEKLNEQLVKHRGMLIAFTQLKKLENNNYKFYAEDMTEFFASFVTKYLHTPIKLADGTYGLDNINTFFQTQKIRDSKIGKQYITIPTHYDSVSKRITLRG